MLSYPRRNLPIRHLVDRFNRKDTIPTVAALETRFQLALCLTRTEYQDRFHIMNTRDDFIIELAELALESSLSRILWFTLRAARISHMSLDVGFYDSGFLSFV
jgi:hypothetical protein